jgi:hypothetical protein
MKFAFFNNSLKLDNQSWFFSLKSIKLGLVLEILYVILYYATFRILCLKSCTCLPPPNDIAYQWIFFFFFQLDIVLLGYNSL